MKALAWPGMAYGCKAQTLKKVEYRRIQAFEDRGPGSAPESYTRFEYGTTHIHR